LSGFGFTGNKLKEIANNLPILRVKGQSVYGAQLWETSLNTAESRDCFSLCTYNIILSRTYLAQPTIKVCDAFPEGVEPFLDTFDISPQTSYLGAIRCNLLLNASEI